MSRVRLDKIWIKQFRNLKDSTIDFDENNLSTVLLGPNASAKSNLLEAIVLIFRDLDLFEDPPFVYNLKYSVRELKIEIDSDPSRSRDKTTIYVNGEKITQKQFRENSRSFLPKNIFGYYSGTSERFQKCFFKHREIFYSKIIYDEEPPLRPLFFAETVHGQYVLLAFFSFKEDKSVKFLDKIFGITGIEEIEFVLKQPYWFSKQKNENDLFWGARGVVRRFLDDLAKISSIGTKEIHPVIMPNKRSTKEERFSLTIRDIQSLQNLALKYKNNVEFFKMLESTALSDLIHELNIKVIRKGTSDRIGFPELSEGEQQLLLVLGLLKFMKDDESLFLLDEPDTHLNPSWKIKYMDMLDDVVGKNETSHILIITHDPLMISGLKKEQVQLFSSDENREISIKPPEIDPIGLGVDGLLTSELFGLESTLDKETLGKLEQKRKLVTKKRLGAPKLDSKENLLLNELNMQLDELGFQYTFRDPLYQKFLLALKKFELKKKIEFSCLENDQQSKITEEIIEEVLAEEK